MPGTPRAIRPALLAVGLAVAGIFALTPLTGSPAVTRVSIVLMAAAIVSLLIIRPWRWDAAQLGAVDSWAPSKRAVWVSAGIAALVVFWFVLTQFTKDSATFENPAHDYPKAIKYSLRPDGSLETAISGAPNQRVVTVVLKKQ